MTALEKAGLLQLLPKMTRIEAMACAQEFLKVYDVRLDWHEFAYYLDELYIKGVLVISKPGGRREYKLNEATNA